MMAETGNQSVQSQSSKTLTLSTVRGNALQVYPAKTNIVGNRPVRDNKAKDTDQLMGYLD